MLDLYTTLNVRLDWSEMDMFGHINNVSYFKYMQAARVNYWEASGIYAYFVETKLGPILASAQCDFIKPMHYPGQIVIKTAMKFIKNSSFGLHHKIIDEGGNVCAEGHDVMVMYDFTKEEKISFPIHLRQSIATLEEKEF